MNHHETPDERQVRRGECAKTQNISFNELFLLVRNELLHNVHILDGYRTHLEEMQSERATYWARREDAIERPEEYLSMIIDGILNGDLLKMREHMINMYISIVN